MEKKSVDEVRDIIEQEGLGFAVQHYMSADTIEDETLARFWKKAGEYLNKIEEYIEANAGGALYPHLSEESDEEEYD